MLLLGLSWFEEGLRVIMAWLCSVIYWIIAGLFELFINISKVQLLSSDAITQIYQRVTMVLTIVMVFYVTFELVKYVIQPDTMKDKEKGASKVVIKMILVVILIAFVPTIFSYAYKIQNAIIEKEVLSKVILGKSNTNSTTFGRNFSADIFSLFYKFDKEYWGEAKDCDDIDCEQLVAGNINTLRATGKLENITYGINKTDKKTENGVSQQIALIRFDGLFAVAVGIFLQYILLLYCIDLGVRVAQITFLQIIAPIPIIGYLQPKKDNMFTKWVKQCLTTYLDLFIRLSIIYFMLLVCKAVADAYNNGTLIQGVSDDASTFVYVAIVMGLLLFAQKAPKMLQELFPKMGAASGNFGLKAGERVAPLAARAIGAGLGSARAGIRALAASGVNLHNRNKALKEKLRKEGKPTDRKSMRKARKDARQNAKESKKQLKDKGRELQHVEDDVRKKEKDLEKAKKSGASKEEIKEKEKALEKAKAKYESVRKGAEEAKKDTKARYEEAEKRKTAANDKYNQAKTKYDTIKNDSTKTDEEKEAARKELDKAEKEKNAAEKEADLAKAAKDTTDSYEGNSKKLKDKAEENYNEVKAKYDRGEATAAELEKAERRFKQAESRYNLEQRTGYLGINTENINAQSALADERNQTYGAYAGIQAVGAAIHGGLTGAVAGAKAKKLGDVWKQSGEGVKKVLTREDARMQYLQDGGSATFTGTVDKAVAHVQQFAHIKTESDIMKAQIKDTEDRVKLLNAQAERETQVKTYLDSAKQRSGQKIDAGEQRIFLDEQINDKNNTIKLSNGEYVSWYDAMGISEADYKEKYKEYTTSSMLQKVREQEKTAENEATAANQVWTEANANYQKMVAQGAPQDELNKEKARVDELENIKNVKAKAAADKKTISGLARKKLLEYGVSRAIQGDTSDNILYDTVQSLRSAIEVSRNIPSARDHVRAGIARRFGGEETAGFQKVWAAFINNDIKDYEDVDVIEGLLTNHVGSLRNDSRLAKAEAERLSESSWKASADAAASGGGGSSKK